MQKEKAVVTSMCAKHSCHDDGISVDEVLSTEVGFYETVRSTYNNFNYFFSYEKVGYNMIYDIFEPFMSKETWSEAAKECCSRGMSLAGIETQEEAMRLSLLFQSSKTG